MSEEDRNIPEEECEYIFTWKIKNYSSFYQENNEMILSPKFEVPFLSGEQWCLQYYPNGCENTRFFVSCYLSWESMGENSESSAITYFLEIIDENKSVLESFGPVDRTFTEEDSVWGIEKFFAADELSTEMSNWKEDNLTLRCRIKSNKLKKHAILKSEAYTTIGTNKVCCEWDVTIPTMPKYTESIFFSISDSYNFELTLTSLLETVKIDIHFKESNSPCQVTFKMSICDKFGCHLASKRAVNVFEVSATFHFPSFITKELLEVCKTDSSHWEFKLNCDAYISNRSTYTTRNLKEVSSFKSDFKKENVVCPDILNDFRSIFVSQKYSDVRMSNGNEEFHVHKLVLKARSPVFAAMFDQDMLENQTGVVVIADMDGKTLKIFLEFLYTGILEEVDCESAKRLMLAADKYEVQSLMGKCACILKSVLSIENVCEIITVADLVNCESLKSCAMQFIVVNAAHLLPTAKWSQWIDGNVKLASFVLSKLSEDMGSKYKLM